MAEWLDKVKKFAKSNVFNFILLVLIALGMTFDAMQTATIYGFHAALDNHKEELNESFEAYQDEQHELILENARNFNKRVKEFNTTLNSRLDTVESTIDPELKRRALVKTIREAITENTDTKLSMRKLNRIANAVIDYSYEWHLPIAMVLAQMKQESGFDSGAESHAKAKGLMQILDHPQRSTADEIAGELGYKGYNIWDVRVNVRFGCYYMRKMLDAHGGNYEDALRAYNFGPHNVAALKAGDKDYSMSKFVVEDGVEVQYLVDKYGDFELDDEGNRIVVQEEHKYPKETRGYVKKVTANRRLFARYGLDKVE